MGKVIPLRTARVMPAQKPHRSVQVVETPWDFIDAVEKRFGKITFDLAATYDNCKVRESNYRNKGYCHYGPGSPLAEDALKQNWGKLKGNLWLNPEFGEIKSWAAKCDATPRVVGRNILFLIPASVGSNWWAEFVDRKARVLFTSPRLTFVSHKSPYPKDLGLCVYGAGPAGYECWRWK